MESDTDDEDPLDSTADRIVVGGIIKKEKMYLVSTRCVFKKEVSSCNDFFPLCAYSREATILCIILCTSEKKIG